MHLTCRGFIIADVYHIIRRFVMKELIGHK